MNEEIMNADESKFDTMASMYADKYPDQVDVYESLSISAKAGQPIANAEIVALGQQLDQFQSYATYVEEASNLGTLGAIPQIALDVITAAVGNSIIPLVASVQPLTDEHGIIYYKSTSALEKTAPYAPGEVISDPLTRDNVIPHESGMGAQRQTEVVGVTAGGTADETIAGTLNVIGGGVLRPYMVHVLVWDSVTGAGTAMGQDNGNGEIMGVGLQGTIDYESGAISVDVLAANNINASEVRVTYDINTDKQDTLPKIGTRLFTKDVRAEIWALSADVGTLANYAFQQRFGRDATDEVASDLANEITRTLNTAAVTRIYNNVVGQTIWNATPGAGISYAEHKLTFVDAMAQAESEVHNNSGVNAINRIIAGRTAAATLRGMPEFTPSASPSEVSVGLYGDYDGVPVIRATDVIPDNEMVCISNPTNYFNAPLVYSPFMPLLMTDTIQSPNNPFKGTKAAAVWAGMTSINGNLTSTLTIA